MAPLLSVTSHFSLMYGVHAPFVLCKRAKALGYTAIGLTDRNNLYGLPQFLKACAHFGLKPLIGALIIDDFHSVLIYADGIQGYRNLCRIITEKQCTEKFSIIGSICAASEGLHVVTTDMKCIEQLHSRVSVYYRISSLRKIPHSIQKMGIPSLIVPHAVFMCKEDYATHTILRAIDIKKSLHRLAENDCASPHALIYPWDTIRDRYRIFEQWLETTDLFSMNIQTVPGSGTIVMPCNQEHSNAEALLREKCFYGAQRRYGAITPAVEKRLLYELDLINTKGFASYFLIVEDIVAQSPRTCGRGSGAASCVAYCLGITNVDPLKHNLMFERFLNPGRVDPPDIDIDFAWDERDHVLNYVFNKYGKDHVAMVANHLCFQPRLALRETARVYGLTESEISAVTKKIPHFYEVCREGIDIQSILKNNPRTSALQLDAPWPDILVRAQKLIGIPRGIAAHCGGVVITPDPLHYHVPLQYTAKGFPVIQWEKDGTEDMGLVKMDLLGNHSLAVIRDTIAHLKEKENVEFDEIQWNPSADPSTIDTIARGETVGVFYVESPAMRLLQKKCACGDFHHLVIHSSIIRPAANKYIDEYVKRLRGYHYRPLHPLLESVLHETYGIMVYQEDVSKVAMALAGFTAVEADALRKILSRKERALKLPDFKEKFFSGAKKNGVAPEAIQRVWNMCLSFTGYSFCKPHSASYVHVSFQSAYLKTHFPAAFMASVLSNYGGYYTTQAYVSEAMRLGITILPPDVNSSEMRFCANGMSIRVGLSQIKGIATKACETIIRIRKNHGRYTTMVDFLSRTGIEEADAECLIGAGACDALEKSANRSLLFWIMRCFFRNGIHERMPQLKALSRRELLGTEYRALGFLTICHPILLLQRKNSSLRIGDLAHHCGRSVSFYGWCVTAKTVMTKQGNAMQFISFEDETGMCETILFPHTYNRFIRYIALQEAFYITGRVLVEFGALSVEIQQIVPAKQTIKQPDGFY